MPVFRYEAVDQSGVPIHGSIEAQDQTALAAQMAERGLKLVSATEVSVDSLVAANRATLPRLFQLRLGEQLREALLTGLPAHDAVRAIAAEPISHPMLGIVPWLWGTSLFVFLLAGVIGLVLGEFGTIFLASGLFSFIVMPAVFMVLRWMYYWRPKSILRKLADSLEAGNSLPSSIQLMMPREVRSVLRSNIDETSKARVAADLVPSLLGGNLRVQQFILTLIGPILLLGVVVMGIHSMMLFVMPQFKKIFEDFGTDLPAMSAMAIGIADFFASFGVAGWLTSSILIVVGIIGLAVWLGSNQAAELLERIPVFGLAFRWAMQARVARILSAMIRNGCSNAESLRVASAGSGFQSVQQQGDIIADELDSGSNVTMSVTRMSGLPISMLFNKGSEEDDQHRRAAIADTFQNLSEMLDMATIGQGKLFALLFQFCVITFTGVVIGFTVIAMFLPLIKLLNDLA